MYMLSVTNEPRSPITGEDVHACSVMCHFLFLLRIKMY